MISARIHRATARQHQVTIAASNAATQRLSKQIVNAVIAIVAKSDRIIYKRQKSWKEVSAPKVRE
jgi:hypothetical protein